MKNLFNIICEDNSGDRCVNINHINSLIDRGETPEMIKIAEAYQEKQFSEVADGIFEKYNQGARIVMLSGPSSSGKTTSSKRLSIFLQILGLSPVMISLDDYFMDREFTPIDENGAYDFEALEAVDVELFNQNLVDLLAGHVIQRPSFDFITGSRYYNPSKKLQLEDNSILIIEGIHALNPALTRDVDENNKYNIFVSPETTIAIDENVVIDPTISRLLRRMVRDYAYRNSSAETTLERWTSVRRGEEKHILPYKNRADVVINSSISFEINVLRRSAEPILQEVLPLAAVYPEAHKLLELLRLFTVMDAEMIPPTSILREFIGGSSFEYV